MKERLDALRRELPNWSLNGFVVPRADEHQGEYVPACSERLLWLSGFSGSAGLAVVLEDTAALFVDGRYTLQAADETDPSSFQIVHTADRSATDWIAATLPAGARLGYDPWLHTPDGARGLSEACQRAGGTLVATEGNPLDRVWANRPPPPLAPVVPHYLPYSGWSSQEKRRVVCADLAAAKIDAAVLAAPDSIAWLLNIRGGDVPYTPLPLSFAIVHADTWVELFVDPRKLGEAVRVHLGASVRIAPPAAFGEALDALGEAAKTVRYDGAGTPMWVLERLRAAGARPDRGADPCALPKACKNPVELAGARAAHRRDGVALTRFLAWLSGEVGHAPITEISAAERLDAFRAEGQSWRGPSFATISAAGANGAIVHYHSRPETDRELTPGMLYLVDSGGQYLDGTTDVTRTVSLGTPDTDQRRRFTQVLKGHIAIASAVFPAGTTGSQLDVLARRALWNAGVDYDHGTGHGVGSYLGVHEGPHRIAKTGNTVALKPGMIVSNEPGYYRAGHYGIRIESLVTVIAAPAPPGAERDLLGFETLTLAPVDRRLIDAALLDGDEVAWLDAYHARVRAALAPLLDPATAAWLEQATGPIASPVA